ncbi:alpha/beta-hydrolase [Coniochaeta sp. PMI_546]|nr:alpha/beta-hydrolase [Coniochaeta sp. PMI_546]
MRYAAAPVGDLRWRAPIEPRPSTIPWESALKFQPVCLGNAVAPPYPGEDEDCLFVNVWTPANATVNSKLPVWVFIQGGGYVFNSNANYDGAEVVEKSGHNIVMVNFNYRVGVWGFLASERLRKDGDLNVGLLDQRRLLLWVKQYISKFGGDPNHVVIHGASAGAGSVALHLSAYGGRDDRLFVGAISESLFFPAQPYVSELEWQFDRIIQRVGCTAAYGKDTAMSCLRGKDMATLQALNIAAAFPGRTAPPNPLFYWTPCVDGDFIQDLPYVLFETGRFLKVPVMFGTDTDEGSAFASNAASPDDISSFFQDNYPYLTSNDTQAILAHYPKITPALPFHNAWFPTNSRAYGEATFICPSLNLLRHITSHTPPADRRRIFAYRYNVRDNLNLAAGLGVPHIFEAAAVFGPANLPPQDVSASYFTYNAPVVPVVMGYWISFVRALDPSVYRAEGAPVWESWDREGGAGQRLKIELGDTCMESVGDGEAERCGFWEGMGRRMRQRRKG